MMMESESNVLSFEVPTMILVWVQTKWYQWACTSKFVLSELLIIKFKGKWKTLAKLICTTISLTQYGSIWCTHNDYRDIIHCICLFFTCQSSVNVKCSEYINFNWDLWFCFTVIICDQFSISKDYFKSSMLSQSIQCNSTPLLLKF